jgi:hypothetical protein
MPWGETVKDGSPAEDAKRWHYRPRFPSSHKAEVDMSAQLPLGWLSEWIEGTSATIAREIS